MNSFWRFLRNKRNQQVLGWLGGGLIVVATGLWAAFMQFFPLLKAPEKKASHPVAVSIPAPVNVPAPANVTPPVNVQADCSGIAIGGNVSGSTVSTGAATNSDCAPKPK